VKVKTIEVPDRLLTPDEVCERLSVTPRWLRRAVDEGRIERVKVGALNRFRESYIDEIVQNGLPVDN
jgi:excisionase family DNA binding protein